MFGACDTLDWSQYGPISDEWLSVFRSGQWSVGLLPNRLQRKSLVVRESTKFVRGARNLFPHWVEQSPLVQSAWSTCNNPVQVFSRVCVAATTLIKYFYTGCGCSNLTQVHSPMCVDATTLFKNFHPCVWLQLQPYSSTFTVCVWLQQPYSSISHCVWLQQPYSSTFTLRVAAQFLTACMLCSSAQFLTACILCST